MFGSAGKLYVYFTYGMHYCCNVVVGEEGYGAAVLIRAVEPVDGEEVLTENRPGKSGVELTNGPAKLCQALSIDKRLNGHDLEKTPMRLRLMPPLAGKAVVKTVRVGISQAKEVEWRFYEKDNPYVSKT
jgi:DNA-3-methyladenine glycosylase